MNCPKTTKIDGIASSDTALTHFAFKVPEKRFSAQIITGDEKWILYDNAKRRKS